MNLPNLLSNSDEPIRILVVDDDASMLRLLQAQFSKHFGDSAEVNTCLNSEEAIGLCAKLQIAVLLTDLKMETLNGFHLLKSIKEKWPFMQVVIMTGSESMNALQSALQLGADDYFVKPAEPARIMESVAFMANRVRRWKQNFPQLLAENPSESGTPSESASKT
jgi:two-component system response regulator YesN